MFLAKEDGIGLSILYEGISRKEFEDLKSFVQFSEKFPKIRSLYDIMNKN